MKPDLDLDCRICEGIEFIAAAVWKMFRALSKRSKQWFRSITECVFDFIEAMDEVKNWPRWLRRIYVVTWPISFLLKNIGCAFIFVTYMLLVLLFWFMVKLIRRICQGIAILLSGKVVSKFTNSAFYIKMRNYWRDA